MWSWATATQSWRHTKVQLSKFLFTFSNTKIYLSQFFWRFEILVGKVLKNKKIASAKIQKNITVAEKKKVFYKSDVVDCTSFWARFSLEAGLSVSGAAFQCLLEFILKLTNKNNNFRWPEAPSESRWVSHIYIYSH